MLYLIIFLIEIFIIYQLSKKTTRLLYSLIYRISKSKFWTKYIFSLIFLPGTFLHEISHFLAALFLLVKVSDINLLPRKTEKGLRMGSVSIGKTDPIRRLIIGIAPAFVGIFTIVFGIAQILEKNLIYDWRVLILTSYLLFVIGNTMFSSGKDMEGSYKVLIVVVIISSLLWIFEVKIPIYELISDMSVIFKRVSFLMIAPIFLDLIIINLLRLTEE